jgi:hypothetical protein
MVSVHGGVCGICVGKDECIGFVWGGVDVLSGVIAVS